MTVSELALVIQKDSRRDISAALVLAAEALPILRLPDGRRIHDQIDFHDLLEQLAEALLVPMESLPLQRTIESAVGAMPTLAKTSRFIDPCPRCGHVHKENKECGFEFRPGENCACVYEARVSA